MLQLSASQRTTASLAASKSNGSRLSFKACLVPVNLSPTRASRKAKSRQRLTVESNELNKWAGRAMDDEAPENPFDKDTASVLLRVLTARSVKRVLQQVTEFDLVVAQWFTNFCHENPPTEGNKFIVDLLDAKGTTIQDPTTGAVHTVDPQKLAHRILTTRAEMAEKATLALPQYVELENTSVLRSYLERNTYMSGSPEAGSKDRETRRGYFRRRTGGSS